MDAARESPRGVRDRAPADQCLATEDGRPDESDDWHRQSVKNTQAKFNMHSHVRCQRLVLSLTRNTEERHFLYVFFFE